MARLIATGALMAYQFNASLSSAIEIGTGSTATATGVATLCYNDFGTTSLDDNLYDFPMPVFGL